MVMKKTDTMRSSILLIFEQQATLSTMRCTESCECLLNGVIDDIKSARVQGLQPGVRLTAIFDSCHSGSALDLPYVYSTQGLLKEPNLAKEAGMGLLGIVSSYARGDLMGMAGTAMGLFKKAVSGDEIYQKNLRTKTSPADVIMWSGSKDSQTS
jgi:metacaspase-1